MLADVMHANKPNVAQNAQAGRRFEWKACCTSQLIQSTVRYLSKSLWFVLKAIGRSAKWQVVVLICFTACAGNCERCSSPKHGLSRSSSMLCVPGISEGPNFVRVKLDRLVELKRM